MLEDANIYFGVRDSLLKWGECVGMFVAVPPSKGFLIYEESNSPDLDTLFMNPALFRPVF